MSKYMIDLPRLQADFICCLESACSQQTLIELKNKWIKQNLIPLYGLLQNTESLHKPLVGKQINELKAFIEVQLKFFSRQFVAKNVHQTSPEENLTLNALHLNVGKVHLLNQVIYTIATWFLQYGFQVVELDEVVSSNHCFDLLNVPVNHPARSEQDTFYFDQTTLLRPHCTVTSAIFLQQYSGKGPLKLLTYGNVYRNDDDDPTHSHQFMQIDFLWLESGISVANLKWLLQRLLNYLFRQELAVRYRLSYFPFTEPSFECDISCIICQQQGCSICKKTGWIEVLGAGMLHSEVLKLTKTDSQLSAIACGMGVERLAMLLYQIEDIRNFYFNNFNFLHSF